MTQIYEKCAIMRLTLTAHLRGLIKMVLFRFNRTLLVTKNQVDVIGLISKLWPYSTGIDLVRI